jgi:hypothetical protein
MYATFCCKKIVDVILSLIVCFRRKLETNSKEEAVTTWNIIFSPAILQKLIAIVCWGGFKIIFGYNICKDDECNIPNPDMDDIDLMSILWIIGCFILSIAVRGQGELCKMPRSTFEHYYFSAFLSLLGQVLFSVGGLFFFGAEYFECCKNIHIVSAYVWFSLCGAMLLLTSVTMDSYLLPLRKNIVITDQHFTIHL